MKRILPILMLLMLLCGCGGQEHSTGELLLLRQQIQKSAGAEFDAAITADYGDKTYTFGMECHFDCDGNLRFVVTQPQPIAGISGNISEAGGKLTFDDTALAFEMLVDGMLSPISAPWILMRCIRAGYIHGCSMNGETVCTQLDDSYRGQNLQAWVWTDSNKLPVAAEIMYHGKRVLSISVENFKIL